MTTVDAETVTVRNLIGGERRQASDGASFERRNPADSRAVVSVAPESTTDDVTSAVDAALDGLATWRAVDPDTPRRGADRSRPPPRRAGRRAGVA
ncbi:MAG: hypothetical protein WKF58_09100 [Ilumatobacteraceae bacterium]